MKHKFNRFILFLLPVAGLLSIGTVKSQPLGSDSLSLKSIISEVVQNHPLVLKALEEINVSDAKIGLAKSGNLPNVGFESSYTRIGPISTISIPDLGTFSFIPHDNYTAAVNATQVLYDFGKTEKNIQLEVKGKELSSQSVELVKQKISQVVIGHYYTLVYLQEAIKIKDEQLLMLNQHLRYVQKKLETGSATNYEILTTQVRVSTIENQKTDLLTAMQVQMSQLNSLLGKPENSIKYVKNELQQVSPEMQDDTPSEAAIKNRDEMKLAGEKAKLAQLRYNIVSAQNNPVFSAFLSGGVKNGYTPYLYDPKANFAAGIGVRIPIFDGKRKEFSLVQAQSAIQSNDQETEITRRSIVDEVLEAEANLKASIKKVDQSELQLRQASEAYELAKVKFDSGVITNLELIEGSTAVSESRLMVLKSKIDYTVNIFKVKSAVGERLY